MAVITVSAWQVEPGDVLLIDAVPIPVGHKVVGVTDRAPANVVISCDDGYRKGYRWSVPVKVERG